MDSDTEKSYDDMVISYLRVTLKYRSYIKLQVSLVVLLLIVGILFLIFGSDSEVWLIKNGSWFFFTGEVDPILRTVLRRS